MEVSKEGLCKSRRSVYAPQPGDELLSSQPQHWESNGKKNQYFITTIDAYVRSNGLFHVNIKIICGIKALPSREHLCTVHSKLAGFEWMKISRRYFLFLHRSHVRDKYWYKLFSGEGMVILVVLIFKIKQYSPRGNWPYRRNHWFLQMLQAYKESHKEHIRN